MMNKRLSKQCLHQTYNKAVSYSHYNKKGGPQRRITLKSFQNGISYPSLPGSR